MGYTVNSIIIKKEMNELFEIINDVRNWPELHNYQDVKILEKEELLDGRRKIVFQVTGNKEEEPVEIWTSQRIIDVTNMCARGVRLEPMYPFRHWILDVVLSVEKEGTKMTWIQDFSMAGCKPGFEKNGSTVCTGTLYPGNRRICLWGTVCRRYPDRCHNRGDSACTVYG